MRLTLRTLLAYLDDTLEPAQAKIIGQKVAESDQARELMEHIKQVTRRRRITTPPGSGPGSKIDPNTIAEYLDGAVSAEQASEVEQICLGSDVHLAEIAACHQILALVLGEPALVPPTAKSRMYGLVKGPESIPFRKPGNANRSADPDHMLHGDDIDETLRMGVPLLGGKGSWTQILTLIGAGIGASILLFLAITYVLRLPGHNDANPNKSKEVVQKDPDPKKKENQNPGGDTKKKNGNEPKNKKKLDNKVKKNENDYPLPPPPNFGTPEKDPAKKLTGTLPENRFWEADNRPVQLGKYVMPAAKEASVVAWRDLDKTAWTRLWGAKVDVDGGRSYAALPGFRGDLDLKRGVRLSLLGNLPEIMPNLNFAESVVDLHSHDSVDLDMTLRRGRVALTSTREKPVVVRIRYDNPDKPEQAEFADLILHGKGAQVIVSRYSFFPPGVPFVKDPKSPKRVSPAVFQAFWATEGDVTVRVGDAENVLSAPMGKGSPEVKAVVKWSNKVPLAAESLSALPEFVTLNPPPYEGMAKEEKSFIAELTKARDDFSFLLRDKALDVGLAETLKSKLLGRRIVAVRSYAALGFVDDVIDVLADERLADVHTCALRCLLGWMALERDNEYKLFNQLHKTKRFTLGESEKIMELLHGAVFDDELLVDYLNNPNLVIRELASMQLPWRVPPGQAYPVYNATMDSEMRVAVQQHWRELLRKLKTTPPPPAPKK